MELNKIYIGDVLEVLKSLPDNSIDLAITSPPYNKGENKKGWLVGNVKYKGVSDKMKEEEYQKWQIEVLNEVYRVIKPGGSFFYNHKIRWERGVMLHPIEWISKSNWHIRQEIIWDRGIAANIRGWRFWQVEERIYWLYKPRNKKDLIGDELLSKHALLTSIWRIPPEKNNPHPAPFPIEIPTRIIYSIFDEEKDKIILDPFAGSGTTLVAAKALNHNYIGIEKVKEYAEFAKERLKNYQKELPKIEEELKKHKVKKTFKERKAKGEFTGRHKPKTTLF
jgi:modification methylase